MTDETILQGLRNVLNYSYSPYSKIRVASAIKYKTADSEEIEFGTNVENVSYGLTNCAERTAVFSAITKGMRSITEVYIMSNLADPITPCGACRQVLAEFITDGSAVNVICLNEAGDEMIFSFDELLPDKFRLA